MFYLAKDHCQKDTQKILWSPLLKKLKIKTIFKNTDVKLHNLKV